MSYAKLPATLVLKAYNRFLESWDTVVAEKREPLIDFWPTT